MDDRKKKWDEANKFIDKFMAFDAYAGQPTTLISIRPGFYPFKPSIYDYSKTQQFVYGVVKEYLDSKLLKVKPFNIPLGLGAGGVGSSIIALLIAHLAEIKIIVLFLKFVPGLLLLAKKTKRLILSCQKKGELGLLRQKTKRSHILRFSF